jgi:high affinity Mn2+ porin
VAGHVCLLSAQVDPASPGEALAADRFWLSGQANFIEQFHTPFHARYSGPNSLQATGENALSRVLTLYTGVRLTRSLELLCDIESTAGRGISDALGIAGFTNLDVVRNPTLGAAPYFARLMLHGTIALSSERTEATRTPLSLASSVPARRLEVRFGKLSTADFFDVNSIGSDSHLQFMNWTADNNGAYDYAADTRGYTYGALFEYYDQGWALRFGEMLMPKIANGIHLDANVARARAENIELELHPSLIRGRNGAIRPLVFVNHANMGSYREANQAYLAGVDPAPDITAHRKQGRIKYGFGLNGEQELTASWRVYGRLGWNEGRNESFAYTEVDKAASVGSDIRGGLWHRTLDKAGAAFLSNALSSEHRQYLAMGGQGFLLGDGGLHYGLEQIVEVYYNLHLWRGISFSADLQRIWNPGYNKDRGPVLVPSFRMHFEDAVSFSRVRR